MKVGNLVNKKFNINNNSFYNRFDFGNKVLILVPHEDDEINIAHDLPFVLSSRGIEVFIAFSSNGDFFKKVPGETRINEALKVANYYGLDKEHVIFLGYADRYTPINKHLYNYEDTEQVTSHIGKTQTYGIEALKPEYHFSKYNEHAAYTKQNFTSDIYDLISDIKADTILCIDFDTHPDHIALSLTFDHVMGKLLKESNYRPLILSGFAYETCFYGERDYNTLNLESCKKPVSASKDPYLDEDSVFPSYNWKSRMRFPVLSETMPANIYKSIIYKALKLHHSQFDARSFSGRIINGDKVYFIKRTDSLSYTADITVSSGNATFLNDFVHADSNNITEFEQKQSRAMLDKCVWHPEETDKAPFITCTFNNPASISCIALYERSINNSVINKVSVIIDDTFVMSYTNKKHDGSADYIMLPETYNCKSLKITIDDYSCMGNNVSYIGLSELEIFESFNLYEKPTFIKITNNDNFVYDYKIIDDGTDTPVTFGIYTPPFCKKESSFPYTITCDAKYTINSDNTFSVYGVFKKCTVKVSLTDDPSVYDVITITKISSLTFTCIKLNWLSEKYLWFKFRIYDKIRRIKQSLSGKGMFE